MNDKSDKKDIAIQKDNDLNANSSLMYKGYSESGSIIKKTEKIVAAIYLVSGLVPDNDPLKLSIRSQSISLLSFINSVSNPFDKNEIKNLPETISLKINNIISLINIAFYAGYVSQMNLSLVKGELEWLELEIKNNHSNWTDSLVLSKDFLVSKAPETLSQGQIPLKTNHLQAVKDRDLKAKNRKSSRCDLILSSIKKRGQPTVKDISTDVRGISEKTIQRELVSLIENGFIKRNGERRWSTYALIS